MSKIGGGSYEIVKRKRLKDLKCAVPTPIKEAWLKRIRLTDDDVRRCSVRSEGFPRTWKDTARMLNTLIRKRLSGTGGTR